jgi:TRAP-type C4-dicarboxylate transport system permease small subunit
MILKIFTAFNQVLLKIEKTLIVLFLSLMIILTFAQILLRAFYGYGHLVWANNLLGQIDWSGPLVRLLVLWLSFLGASLVSEENKHIKMDLISGFLPAALQPWRELLLSLTCIFISAVMTYASFTYLKIDIGLGSTTFLGLPNWLGEVILPLGFLLILFKFFLRSIEQALRIWKGGKACPS